MKTITLTLYRFDELSNTARDRAIADARAGYEEDNDFGAWAIDDCSLLEPPDKELTQLLGKDYNFPLIKNTREGISFTCDEWLNHLDCTRAIEITNTNHFLKWLGVPEEENENPGFTYEIYTDSNGWTTIDFDGNYSSNDDAVDTAKAKFNNHIRKCLQRIASDIRYRLSDDGIAEDLRDHDTYYLENGKIFKHATTST